MLPHLSLLRAARGTQPQHQQTLQQHSLLQQLRKFVPLSIVLHCRYWHCCCCRCWLLRCVAFLEGSSQQRSPQAAGCCNSRYCSAAYLPTWTETWRSLPAAENGQEPVYRLHLKAAELRPENTGETLAAAGPLAAATAAEHALQQSHHKLLQLWRRSGPRSQCPRQQRYLLLWRSPRLHCLLQQQHLRLVGETLEARPQFE